MNPKAIDALKSLSQLALTAPDLEPLVVYDSVAALAARLAESMNETEGGEMSSAAQRASTTAEAVRNADRCQLSFREYLNLGSDVR